MKIHQDFVLGHLNELQEKHGVYTGTDLVELAEKLRVTYRGIRKRLATWVKKDPEFKHLTYLGKTHPTITLDEFLQMKVRLYSNLKTYGGTDLQEIYNRLIKAKEWFSKYKICPMKYYPDILNRGSRLKSLLTSIPPNQQEDIQARLIFEIQNAYIIEGSDLFLDELIHRRGRIQQSMNASRQKTEHISFISWQISHHWLC